MFYFFFIWYVFKVFFAQFFWFGVTKCQINLEHYTLVTEEVEERFHDHNVFFTNELKS